MRHVRNRFETAELDGKGLLLVGFGSLYYYDLGLTLMTKSWLLLGSGALLLGTRQLLKVLNGRTPS